MPEPPSPPSPRGRFRRALGFLGKALGVTGLFAASLAGSALLTVDMDLPAVRRAVQQVANVALKDLFQNELHVGDIQHLNLARLDVKTVDVVNDRGESALNARGVHARFDVLGVLKGALYGVGVQETIIESFTVDHADVTMPLVTTAFIPRPVREAKPSPPPERPQRFLLKHIEVRSAWVHGFANEKTPIDADVHALSGSLVIDSSAEEVSGALSPAQHAVLQLDIWSQELTGRLPAPGVLQALGDFHLRIDSRDQSLSMWAGLNGTFDGEPLTTAVFTKLHTGAGGQPVPYVGSPTPVLALHAYLDATRIPPERLREVLPTLSIERALSGRAYVGWEDQKVQADVHASLDDAGSLDLTLWQSSPTRVEGHVSARALDLRAVGVSQVTKPITLDARLDSVVGSGPRELPEGIIVDLHSEPTAVAGQLVPELDIHFAKSGEVMNALITAHEEGAPVNASFTWGRDEILRFETSADVPSLAALPRLKALRDNGITLTSRDLRVAGSITPKKGEGLKGLADGALDATLQGSVASLRVKGGDGKDGVSLDNAVVMGRVKGKVRAYKDLTLDASVQGSGLKAGGEHADEVRLSASGRLFAPQFEANLDRRNGDTIGVSGDLNLDDKRVNGVKVKVKRGDVELEGDVAKVSFKDDRLTLDGLHLAGSGVKQVSGGLVVDRGELIGKLHGEGIDLSKIAKLTGKMPPLVGLADIDVDLQRAKKGRTGHVALRVEGATHKGFDHSLSTSLTATFDGDKITLDAGTRLMAKADDKEPIKDRCAGALAGLRISNAQGTLQGPLLAGATWKKLGGTAEIAADELDLRCLQRFVTSLDVLPRDLLPAGVRNGLKALTAVEVGGKLNASIQVSHDGKAGLPSIEGLSIKTRGLTVKGPVPKGKEEPAWVSNEIDVKITGKADGKTGKVNAEVSLLDQATIASLTVDTTLNPLVLAGKKSFAEEARRTPITAKLTLPKRPIAWLDSIPQLAAIAPRIAGTVGVQGHLQGTLEEPIVTVRILADKIAETIPRAERQPGVEAAWSLPMDMDATLVYNGHNAALDVLVRHGGKQVARATGGVDLAVAELWAGQKPQIKGGLRAALDNVPLGDIPYFADRGVSGALNGVLSIAGLGGKPSVHAALDAGGLKLGEDSELSRGLVKLDIDPPGKDGKPNAVAIVDLAGKDGGTLALQSDFSVRWDNGLSPSIDDKRPMDAKLVASRFHLAAAQPFLEGTLSRLDGLLDGKATIKMGSLDQKPAIDASMKITRGVFNLPAIGQEFTGGTLSIEAKGGKVAVRDIGASGTKGRFKASADASFDGVRFKDASLTIEIPERDEIPITLQGAPLGDAFGKIAIKAIAEDKLIKVTVGVPTLTLILPKAIARSTQGLDDHPEVRLSKKRKRPVERIQPSGRVALTFDIGSIFVKSASLGEVEIAGSKTAPLRLDVVEGEPKVSGDLNIVRGKLKIEILKRTFEIERGLVHLRPEDIANPYVNVTARWDTPDKQSIYIDYIGVVLPVTEQKLKLRSPTIPERDIYATLLLGGVQQSTFDSKSLAGTGQQLGGALLASQLNVQLSNNFSTSFSTNQDGSIRPGITYSSGDKTIELSTYESAGQANAVAGDTASRGQHTQITIDWRFYNRWSLRGYVDMGSSGQTNSGLDVLWLYRY